MKNRGFTLIELLVVIAIISILAGIAFPVFARAKDGAYRGSDISNMNQLRSALQLYRADQGAYPPAILGYATGYSNFTPTDADIVPADRVQSALYPKRVPSLDTFRPAYQRLGSNPNTQFTQAQWPNRYEPAGYTGDPLRLQRFGPETIAWQCVEGERVNSSYYKISGYDVAPGGKGADSPYELRYAPFWTGFAVPTGCGPNDGGGGSGADDPRQLGYTDPPESTVVTWNSFFRDWESDGLPSRGGKRDLVLFLGGSARAYDSREVFEKSWQVQP